MAFQSTHHRSFSCILLLPALRPRDIPLIVSRLILLPRATSSKTQSRPSVMQYVFRCLDRIAAVDRNQSQLHGAAKVLDECLPRDDFVQVSSIHYIVNLQMLFLPSAFSREPRSSMLEVVLSIMWAGICITILTISMSMSILMGA
jgi:hypothetical protein